MRKPAVFIAAAVAALVLVGAPADAHGRQRKTVIVNHGQLVDLAPDVDGAYDGAYGLVVYRTSERKGTQIKVRLWGVDKLGPNAIAHLHNGSCGDDFGGHYQDEVGGAVDDVNEAWQYLKQRKHRVKGRSVNEWMVRPGQRVSIGFHNGGPPEACLNITG